MELEIVQVGNPVLRQRARDLSREEILGGPIQRLIADMRDTMRAAPGVGLAAPQIGEPLRIAVIEDKADYLENVPAEILAERERRPVPFHAIINPRLTVEGDERVELFEGCLSFAGFVGLVPRARAVRVECLNERAEPVTISARGWYARILQHEIDHLDGFVCIDRMWMRSLMSVANHARYWAGKSALEVRAALAGEG
jgi:peptide deformylase